MDKKKANFPKRVVVMSVLVLAALTMGFALNRVAAVTGRARTAPQQVEISKSDLPRNKSGYKMHSINKKVKLERAAAGASPFVTLRLNNFRADGLRQHSPDQEIGD